MRKFVQRQLLDLLDTVRMGIDHLAILQGNAAASLHGNCLLALQQIEKTIQDSGIGTAPVYLEKLETIANDMNSELTANRAHIVCQRIESIQNRLRRESLRLEIAFFPYKSSMWDCMESIWQAANADPNCDCYVVPIPYHDRNPDQSMGTLHYEGRQFPPEVPVVDYTSYDPRVRRPDIVYIHNPYDGYNLVTSVAPQFYSNELSKYTDMLVYIPYYVAGYANELGSGTFSALPAYCFAKRVVAQSEQMRQGFLDMGLPSDHILTLGSPKFDAVINHAKTACPAGWQEKLDGKTVFLVNTSLSDLLSRGDAWLLSADALMRSIVERKDCAVIWRPHPLMEATIRSMRGNLLPLYLNMKQRFLERDNFIFDTSSDYMPAFDASCGLIGDHSSLNWLYGATGKPVLCLTGSKTDVTTAKYRLLDYSEFYFLNDGDTAEEYIDMVRQKADPRKSARLAALTASAANMDGTAGEKIHQCVVSQVQAQYSKI